MKESVMQRSLLKWVKTKYPRVTFISTSTASGGFGTRLKAADIHSEDAHSDIIFLKKSGQYSYLCIELKAGEDKIFSKKGVLKINPDVKSHRHLIAQHKFSIKCLNDGGFATFCCSLNEAMIVIKCYMNIEKGGEYEEGLSISLEKYELDGYSKC